MRIKLLWVIWMCLVFTGQLDAAPQKPLTNADVVQLIKAGFEDTIVIKSIDANDTDFDMSAEALLALKNAGVSTGIIQVMLDTQARKKSKRSSQPVPPPELNISSDDRVAIAGPPNESGVYYKVEDKFTVLEKAPMPTTKVNGLMKGNIPYVGLLSGPKGHYVFRGAHAPIQCPEGKPTFYLRSLEGSGRDVQLVRLEAKKTTREVQNMAIKGVRGVESGYKNSDLREILISRLSPSLVAVTPSQPLTRGEYILLIAGVVYDFGIAGGR